MSWYSIRTVYRHGAEEDGTNIFEERILLVRATDTASAFARAEAELSLYLKLNPTFERIGEWVAFQISFKGDLGESTEVWSGLSRSHLAPPDYYRARYSSFELGPDETEEAG